MHETAREDGSKVVICSTAVEQMAHVGEVALEQVQRYISGQLLLSEGQVGLDSVDSAHECFVSQVAQILHSDNQLFNSPGGGEVSGEMIPQVGFIARQVRPTLERVGIQ